MRQVNKILAKTHTMNVTQSNDLIYATLVVVTERFGIKMRAKYKKKEPIWKRRLEIQVSRDLNRLECVTVGKTLKASVINELERKYKLQVKGLPVVKEDLKQRLVANVER